MCSAFGDQITYVPMEKSDFTALCLFAVNIGMTGLEGFISDAFIFTDEIKI